MTILSNVRLRNFKLERFDNSKSESNVEVQSLKYKFKWRLDNWGRAEIYSTKHDKAFLLNFKDVLNVKSSKLLSFEIIVILLG